MSRGWTRSSALGPLGWLAVALFTVAWPTTEATVLRELSGPPGAERWTTLVTLPGGLQRITCPPSPAGRCFLAGADAWHGWSPGQRDCRWLPGGTWTFGWRHPDPTSRPRLERCVLAPAPAAGRLTWLAVGLGALAPGWWGLSPARRAGALGLLAAAATLSWLPLPLPLPALGHLLGGALVGALARAPGERWAGLGLLAGLEVLQGLSLSREPSLIDFAWGAAGWAIAALAADRHPGVAPSDPVGTDLAKGPAEGPDALDADHPDRPGHLVGGGGRP